MAKTNTTNTTTKLFVTLGIVGMDAIPANAAVLQRDTTAWVEEPQADGSTKKVKKSVTAFMAVGPVRSTRKDDIILPVLAYFVSEARNLTDFRNAFEVVTVKGKAYATGIKRAVSLATYLNTDTIFKSDGQGVCSKGVSLPLGTTFSRTDLKVKPISLGENLTDKQRTDRMAKNPLLFTDDMDVLKAVMRTTAKAVAKNADFQTDILTDAQKYYSAALGEASAKAPAQDAPESEAEATK